MSTAASDRHQAVVHSVGGSAGVCHQRRMAVAAAMDGGGGSSMGVGDGVVRHSRVKGRIASLVAGDHAIDVAGDWRVVARVPLGDWRRVGRTHAAGRRFIAGPRSSRVVARLHSTIGTATFGRRARLKVFGCQCCHFDGHPSCGVGARLSTAERKTAAAAFDAHLGTYADDEKCGGNGGDEGADDGARCWAVVPGCAAGNDNECDASGAKECAGDGCPDEDDGHHDGPSLQKVRAHLAILAQRRSCRCRLIGCHRAIHALGKAETNKESHAGMVCRAGGRAEIGRGCAIR